MVNVFLEERKEKKFSWCLSRYVLAEWLQARRFTNQAVLSAILVPFNKRNKGIIFYLQSCLRGYPYWDNSTRCMVPAAENCLQTGNVRLRKDVPCMDGRPLETFSSRGQNRLASPQCKAISYPMR